MKRLLLSAALALLCVASIAQSLQTIKTYHDPYTRSQPEEVYTVIANTAMKHGAYKRYSSSGFLIEEANFNRNTLNGPYKMYGVGFTAQEMQKLQLSANYLNGELHGEWVKYHVANNKYQIYLQQTYKNGEVIKEIQYDNNGNKIRDLTLNGVNTYWHDNGKMFRQLNKKDNIIYGPCREWYSNGQLCFTVEMVNDFMNGKKLTYYPTGELQSEEEFSNGQYIGTAIGYYPSKSMKIKIIYDAPNNELSTTCYHENGKVTAEGKRIADGIYLHTEYDTVDFHKSIEYELPAENYFKKEYKYFNRKTTYNADGTKSSALIRNDKNNIREETYYPSGEIKIVYDYDNTTQSYTESGVLQWKVWKDKALTINGKKCYPYEDYDASGNITKKGYIDSENSSDVQYVSYENGVKTSELKSTGEIYEYYPTGKVKEHYRPTSNTITKFDEQGGVSLILDTKQRGSISYYPNKIIKEKGYINENYEPTGVWYYYNDKGKLLAVKENGVERKPNSTDKNSHEAFLSDLHKTNLKINQ